MTERTWDCFFPDVLPDVLGCPEPTVEQHLRRAAQEFCQRALCWREDLPAITTRASVTGYAIPFPSGAQLVKVLGASLNGQDIALEAADGTTTADRRAGNTGSTRIRLDDAASLTLLPTAAAGLALVIEAALKPSELAAGLPDAIADQYRLAIATGALATLLNINRAEWRNQTLAEAKAALFQQAIGKAQTAAWKAHSRTRPRMVAQYF